MKILKVTVMCDAYYQSEIQVPDDMTEKKAIEYAKEHISEIVVGDLEFNGSEVIDDENCYLD